MKRFEDSIELFGIEGGGATYSEQQCDICGTIYNKDCGTDTEQELSDFAVRHTSFGLLEVCECCYGEIEKAVLDRMSDILPWYRRFVDTKIKEIRAINYELVETEKKVNESK